jgi:hypothetical protein
MYNDNMCKFCTGLRPAVNGICESCKGEYTTIRTFIEKYPISNLMDISNATKISLAKIRTFLDKGYFSIRNDRPKPEVVSRR